MIVLVGLGAFVVGGCGRGSEERQPALTAPPPASTPQQRAQTPPELPVEVPLKASRAGDPAAIGVIRRWTEALRAGDVSRASALWAVPSKVQNGTPVLTLSTLADVELFNDSLSCGSQLVSGLGADNGFTIAVFALTQRPGADCGGGTGQDARTAILVRGGKIAEWYRLPDDPDAPRPAPPPAAPAPQAPQEPGPPII
ncbi:MAG: hypothetical protein Q8O56_02715 [Solirubrobacteraceae bacterium]|nr:hypothetical protein [Solirubrobacteraceae bacterium]